MATYCFSDLHGQYNLWKQIEDFIKPEDTVFCLGDCIDRGNAGLKILNEIIKTPNITLLRGNHEDFINHIGSEIIQNEIENPGSSCFEVSTIDVWSWNGGEKSIEDFNKLSLSQKQWLVDYIKSLPTHIEYTNTKGEKIYLCHAGRQPDTIEIEDMQNGEGNIPMHNFLWDRKHLKQKKWNGKDNEYCVHGHTPVCYMYRYSQINADGPAFTPNGGWRIFRYCQGHKINIDLCSAKTHTACLLNLDTWESVYFKDDDYLKEGA